MQPFSTISQEARMDMMMEAMERLMESVNTLFLIVDLRA